FVRNTGQRLLARVTNRGGLNRPLQDVRLGWPIRPRAGRKAMKTVCAAIILVAAATVAASAQTPDQRGTMSTVPPDVVKDLAPTAKLRAAINLGNSVLAQKDKTTGALGGVTVDLAHELARRAGVPVEFVPFEAAGKVFEALKSGVWDIAFLAIEPVRAA